jgi:hypothetical protein
MWAVREAVAKAGHAGNAQQALIFYRVLAHELNRACDEGRLPAGPRRDGFVPPWRDRQTPVFVRATREFADFVLRFSRFGAHPPPSTGSPEEMQLFRDLTRERLSPPEGELDVVGAERYMLNLWKVGVLHQAGKALRPVITTLFWVAQILALARVGWLLARRRWSYPLTVAAAAWGACAGSILIHALIEATSFPVLTISSFAPIYPLVLVFIVAAFWDAAGAVADWRTRRRERPAVGPRIVGGESPAPVGEPGTGAPSTGRLQRVLPWLGAGLALVPFLVWHRSFRELFWFGDDFLFLDQLTILTFRDWSLQVFSENFVPVFKLLWGGALFAFGGNYTALLTLLWLSHALITLLLGRVLRDAGLPAVAALFVQVVFGLTAANLETLGWAVQWSAVLAAGFMVLALWVWFRPGARRSWGTHLALAACVAASACSFSRGVVTGGVALLAVLLPLLAPLDWRGLLRRVPAALLCLAPAAAVAVLIKLNSTGLHQQFTSNPGMVMEYGLSYFLLNPAHVLFGGSLHPAALLGIAGAKVGLLAAGLMLARGRTLELLLLLLAYDVGSALLLGIGRYDAGFVTAMSSRYQYSSLVATLPFAGVVGTALLDRLPSGTIRGAVAGVVIIVAGGLCLRAWPAALREFTGWRGTELRALLAAPPTSDPAVRVPALEFMHIERAKALQRAYRLH